MFCFAIAPAWKSHYLDFQNIQMQINSHPPPPGVEILAFSLAINKLVMPLLQGSSETEGAFNYYYLKLRNKRTSVGEKYIMKALLLVLSMQVPQQTNI